MPPVIGWSADSRQPGCVIKTVAGCKRLERYETLVMIHRQYSIKAIMVTAGKECISTVRAHDEHIIILCFFDCRLNDGFLFITNKTFITRMRVQTQYGYPGFLNTKIFCRLWLMMFSLPSILSFVICAAISFIATCSVTSMPPEVAGTKHHDNIRYTEYTFQVGVWPRKLNSGRLNIFYE